MGIHLNIWPLFGSKVPISITYHFANPPRKIMQVTICFLQLLTLQIKTASQRNSVRTQKLVGPQSHCSSLSRVPDKSLYTLMLVSGPGYIQTSPRHASHNIQPTNLKQKLDSHSTSTQRYTHKITYLDLPCRVPYMVPFNWCQFTILLRAFHWHFPWKGWYKTETHQKWHIL